MDFENKTNLNNKDIPLLQVKNLKVYFYLEEGILKAVDDVSFDMERKEVLGIVGSLVAERASLLSQFSE